MGVDIVAELGRQLRHLIDLAASEEDPKAVLLGEEIKSLSGDEACALLMCAVLMIARREIPPRPP